MPCYHPITGYRSRAVNPATGKRSIVFNPQEGFQDLQVTIPCGRCVGCRLDYSRQWAVRCMHEASLYPNNCFITLTFNNENLPEDHSIRKEHLQKFFKRLRKKIGEVRYFSCGEYGEKNNRPHYHAILFGYDFPDKYLFNIVNGHHLYRSPTLEKIWPFGHSGIGSVSFESCAYVARYVMKKRKGKPDYIDPKTGKTNQEHYMLADPDTGEINFLEPEFCLMSRRPGIGRGWLETFHQDTDKDFVTIRGVKHKLPKYYDNILEQENLEAMEQRKLSRKKRAHELRHDNTVERLHVKEKVKLSKIKSLKRNIENES